MYVYIYVCVCVCVLRVAYKYLQCHFVGIAYTNIFSTTVEPFYNAPVWHFLFDSPFQ